MSNIKNKFYKFLLPQLNVSQVYLAIILLIIHSFISFFKTEDGSLIIFLPIFILFLILLIQILHKKKYKQPGYLSAAQYVGTVLISTISFFYVANRLDIYNIQNLNYFDIFFLIFAIAVIIRFFIIFIILFYSDRLSVLKKIEYDFIRRMPDARYNGFDNRLVYFPIVISIIFYLYSSANSFNSSDVAIDLGESLFV